MKDGGNLIFPYLHSINQNIMARLHTIAFSAILFMTMVFSQVVKAQEVKDGLEWYTDITKAYEVSTKTGKPIFAFFTGSDWCGWCHRLEANVFSKDGFKTWAKKNVILLELDFPRNKKLPDALVQQNNSLQQFFQVQGYPTCWVFNMTKNKDQGKFDISPLGQLGYPQAAPGKEMESFISTANGILNKNTKKS